MKSAAGQSKIVRRIKVKKKTFIYLEILLVLSVMAILHEAQTIKA
jgi:hypothetical protein